MSKDWVKDIKDMHDNYGFHDAVNGLDVVKLRKYIKFRADFIGEEYHELQDNLTNPEEIVDALIDICVVAIGTLDLYGVDAHKAWDEILKANMSKNVGVKLSRPNPLGLPDLIKPEGWEGPDHTGNHGKFEFLECKSCIREDHQIVNNSNVADLIVTSRNIAKDVIKYEVHCEKCGRCLNNEDILAPHFLK